jgi:drug/metabolite transporter superfamily protein YnfA
MVKFHTILKLLVRHVLAGAIIILGTLFVAFAIYAVGLLTSSDGIDTPVAEIPAFLMWMLMASVVAVVASTGSFLITAFLQWMRSKRHFSVWLPIVVMPVLTFLIVYLTCIQTKDMAFMASVTGGIFVYFTIYWIVVNSSAAVLDIIRRKLTGQKAM